MLYLHHIPIHIIQKRKTKYRFSITIGTKSISGWFIIIVVKFSICLLNSIITPMSKAILLIFEGLDNPVIRSQVLMHARDMADHGIIDFEIWCVAWSSKMHDLSASKIVESEEMSGCKIRLFKGTRPAMPLSVAKNATLISESLKDVKGSFDFIHARSDYAAAVCAELRKQIDINFIWDCRGDDVAEFSMRVGSSKNIAYTLLKQIRMASIRKNTSMAAAQCSKAIFVTDALRKQSAPTMAPDKFFIIPSSAPESMFFYDEKLRADNRASLGYSENDRVVVFSGGLHGYQCFEESIELFKNLYKSDKAFKLLILTPEVSRAKEVTMSLPAESLKIFSLKTQEMNAYLNAADFGLMLRKHNPVNTSASPVKFAEFALTGLPVIMSDSVPDSYQMALKYGNLCRYESGKVELADVSNRKTVSTSYMNILSRKAVREKYKMLYQKMRETSVN